MIASEQLIAVDTFSKNRRGLDSFLQTTKAYVTDAGHAFDFMNTIKKIAAIFRATHIEIGIDKYMTGAALPYFPVTSMDWICKVKQIKKATFAIADLIRQTFDVAATACYTRAFFAHNPLRALNIATFFDALYDSSALVVNVIQYRDSSKKLALAHAAPLRVQRAIQNDMTTAMIRSAAKIAAVIVGIFACLALILGHALLSPLIAMILAFASSLLAMMAYYHQNYWCNVALQCKAI